MMKITMDLIFTRLFMEQPHMSFDISSLDKRKALTGVRLLPVEKIHLKYDCLYVCDSTHPIIDDGIPEAVSYTHLDVYKRQSWKKAANSSKDLPTRRITAGRCSLPAALDG